MKYPLLAGLEYQGYLLFRLVESVSSTMRMCALCDRTHLLLFGVPYLCRRAQAVLHP